MATPPTRTTARAAAAEAAALGLCEHCGRPLPGRPNQCPHCHGLLGAAADDLKQVAAEERDILGRRRATADLLFLLGLLIGGPLVSFGSRLPPGLLAPAGGSVRVGLFVVLGCTAASALFRWTASSLLATLLVGGLGAAVVAAAVTPPADAAERLAVGADARTAYVAALAHELEPLGGLAEARGPDGIVAWIERPADEVSDCGQYPDARTRTHLAQLGFARVVIANQSAEGVVCTFRP